MASQVSGMRFGGRRNGDPKQVAERLVAVSYDTYIFHIINYKILQNIKINQTV